MVTIDSLILLVKHYHLENDSNCFDKAIEMAKNELGEVLNEEREYPPFIYYLCLEQMYSNPKYEWIKKWSTMTMDERVELFNETIEALKQFID